MYILLQMQEIGIFLLKVSATLFCLFLAYLIILAGREIWKEKAQELRQGNVFANGISNNMKDKDIHNENATREMRIIELEIRKTVQFYKHLEEDRNNYRKMHGKPLVRKGGENYENHINRKLKRGSR